MSEEAQTASPPVSERSQQGVDDNGPVPTPPAPAEEEQQSPNNEEQQEEPPATPKQDDDNQEEQPANNEEQPPVEGIRMLIFASVGAGFVWLY